MRPDWEIVVGKVLDHLWDFAAQHRDANLDLDHVGITGATMGGYFALRGTVDPRIAACISINGYYSMESFTEGRVPGWLWKGFRAGYIPKSIFNAVVRVTSSLNFQPRWEFNHMKWALGQDNEYDMIRRMLDFSLRRHDGSEVLHDVKYPVLVTGAGFSFYFDPSTTTRSITDKLVHLTAEENGEWIARDVAFGGLQAKIGAFGYSMQRTFGWLDKVWQIERYSLRPMGEISSEGEGVNTNGVPDNVFILKKP